MSILLLIWPLSLLGESLPPGATFEMARRDLRAGNLEQAAVAFKDLKKQKGLSDWASLYLAETYFEQGEHRKAEDLCNSVDKKSAASLHAEALKIEIDLAEGKKVKASLELISNKHLPKAKSEYLTILTGNGSGSTAIKEFQNFRSRYSRSIEAMRALKLQQQKFEYSAAEWKDPSLVLSEVKTLHKQGLPDQAFSLGLDFSQNGELPEDSSYRRELFSNLVKIGATLKPPQTLENLESNLRPEEMEDLAFVQAINSARNYWNKSFYSEALTVLRKLPNNEPERNYLEARILEEQGDYPGSIAALKQYVASGDKSNRTEAARRLFFLLLMQKQPNAAREVANMILPEISGDDELKDSILYWRGSEIQALTPNSYYYWISAGNRVAAPLKAKYPRRPKQECMPTDLKISDREHNALLDLQRYGLFDLLTQQFRFQVATSNDALTVLSRAQALSAYGAVQGAISEISSDPIVRKELYSRCLVNVERILYPFRYLEFTQRRASELKLPAPLFLGLIRTESAFNPLAISSAEAKGLMQLIDSTAVQEGFDPDRESLFDERTNIHLGSKHLAGLIQEYEGRWDLGIAAYNAGKAAVERWRARYPNVEPGLWIELIPYDETRRYVKRVMSAYWVYSERFALSSAS